MKALLWARCVLLASIAQTGPADLAIRNVAVVDVTDGTLRRAQTVVVRENRIVAVGPADALAASDAEQVVDGAGGYLVPGLWDTHVHSATSVAWHFPLFLAYGITSVRNMHTSVAQPLELVNSIKKRLADGELLGTRMLANGGVVDGDPPVWPGGSVVVHDAAEARQAVDRLVDGGADFIKVYDRLTPEAYFAILQRAKERKIPVDGHLPPLVTPEQAAAAGQRTIEHGSGIAMGCSTDAAAIRADYERYLQRVPSMRPFPDALIGFFSLVRRAMDTRDAAECMKTVNAYREHGVVVVPTLVAGSDGRAFVNDPTRMGLLPPSVQAQWKGMVASGDDPVETLLKPVAGRRSRTCAC
jgi:hypothetical protein